MASSAALARAGSHALATTRSTITTTRPAPLLMNARRLQQKQQPSAVGLCRRRHAALLPPPRATGPPPSSPAPSDRALAAVPYLLPLLDAFPFGISVFIQFPFLARLFGPLAPLQLLWLSIPFAPFVAFLGVYAGIVNNRSLPRFVRFSAMQAVMLDILLIIPQIVLQGFGGGRVGAMGGAAAAARFDAASGGFDLGRQLYETTNNTVFFFVVACVAYGMGGALVGVPARLPLVAEAADSQVREDPGGF
jgi:hypothetical protein